MNRDFVNLGLLAPIFGHSSDSFMGNGMRPIGFDGFGEFGSFLRGTDLCKFVPDTDVKETEKDYTVEVVLAGYKKEDIKIDMDDNSLTIHAEMNDKKEEKGKEGYLFKEIYRGSFSRSFSFDADVDEDHISAKFVDGVLTVVLPKLVKKESKKGITIE